jgi:hypothetical protein
MAKPGRKYSVDTHPQKAKIIQAILRGEASLRGIAGQFGLPKSAVMRYVKDRLNPQAAAEMAKREEYQGQAVLARIEGVMTRMQTLYDACHEYLRDPDNPEKYDLGPRAWEIDIVYRTVEDGTDKMITRKESLDALLLRLDEAGYQTWEVRFKQADPRKLIIETANALGKQLELIAKIQGALKDQGMGNTQVNILITTGKDALA